jgi:ATP-dependent Clp protease ATP-binding subunit ClpA
MKLAADLSVVLELAGTESLGRSHVYVTPEHLLFALLHDPESAALLRQCKADVEAMKQHLDSFLSSEDHLNGDPQQQVIQSQGFQRILQRAVLHAQSAGRDTVQCSHVLIAFFREEDCEGAWLLEEQGLDEFSLQQGIAARSPNDLTTSQSQPLLDGEETSASNDPLDAYCANLNARAAAGEIDPLIGREKELERMLRILSRRRKNNPLLLGEAGVGKTALAEGLALRIVAGDVPELLADAELFALDLASLTAGTRYRGDFEERLKSVVVALAERPHAILCIDEVHTLVGAGAVSGGAMDAGSLLKPLLSSGRLQCIGATTWKDYRAHLEKDSALARRFQIVEVREPSQDETLRIISQGQKGGLEAHHGVKYSKKALQASVELSVKYLHGRYLPDKAIDVLDEAGAAARLHKPPKKRVGVHEIEATLSSMTKIPTRKIASDERDNIRHLGRDLGLRVFGQGEAIKAVVDSVKRARAGLRPADKTTGSFLFWGPTGVGKTELAKALSDCLGMELLRFDMSEYMERHSVSRLIGAPPGYVGFDQGGLLTEEVIKNPRSVVLLDEIEKAHPDLFNILLQVMDSGQLTDNNGRRADFRNCIVIMTTNAGARAMSDGKSIGFGSQISANSGKALQTIEKTFSPEFRNRLDQLVRFDPLEQPVMSLIVDKFIDELDLQLRPRGVTISLTDEARRWFAKEGHEPAFGARPMSRLIDTKIRKELADELLFGKLVAGGKVKVEIHDGEPSLKISANSEKEAAAVS